MSNRRRKIRLSVQAKVLLPVVIFLILLPTITLWIVNHHISQQMQTEARQRLSTAEGVFLKSLEIRSRDLLLRYRNAVNEPRFKAVAQLGDAKTMTAYLRDLLEEFGGGNDVIFYFTDQGQLLAGARRETAFSFEEFDKVTADVTRMALSGELGRGSVGQAGRVFHVISVPVLVREEGPMVGVVTAGIRIGETAVQELKTLTHTEILLLAGGSVTASTLSSVASEEIVASLPASSIDPREGSVRSAEMTPVVVGGEHFLALRGNAEGNGAPKGFQYVLLSSYEQSLRALGDTQRTLVAVSFGGMLLSMAIVWLLVRRVIYPLRALRDSVEAVGRGDFSKRLDNYPADECGDLAEAFNGMSANVQTSRAELEKTVDTLKATQAQLIQSEKLSAVGQFVAGVAHELNNPLTAVVGFSDLLRQTASSDETKAQLDMLTKSAGRCHKIVQSLLGFARQHPPERKLVKVNSLIDEVLEIMSYDLRTSNIQVVKQYDTSLPAIMADAHQLQQVFINILSNARQAMQAVRNDGMIVIRTFAEERLVHVEFQDNGPGIRREHISRIFDPFFTTKPVGKGTGLGLSLSYGIIQEHGGRIHVQSEAGHGAKFIIDLPVSVEATTTSLRKNEFRSAGTASHSPWPEEKSGKRILVIDDEEAILKLAESILKREGHEVDIAPTGEQAVLMLGLNRYDVLVCDWKMPGLNGVQLYEHLAATDPVSAQRMVFLTGDVISETFQEFLSKSGKMCLPKPFSIQDFRNAIAHVLAGLEAPSP